MRKLNLIMMLGWFVVGLIDLFFHHYTVSALEIVIAHMWIVIDAIENNRAER